MSKTEELKETANQLLSRTELKLRFAKLYVDLLTSMPANGSDAERAHQESFLFHLCGVRDAFLDEICLLYGLPHQRGLSAGTIRERLPQEIKSKTLAEFHALENDTASWYSRAKTLRDYGMHRGGVGRDFFVTIGGPGENRTTLRDPRPGITSSRHYPDEFAEWLENMRSLIASLRAIELG